METFAATIQDGSVTVDNTFTAFTKEKDDCGVDVINWDQLEQELFSTRKVKKHGSKLMDTLNLREEIRRQLAENDKKNLNDGKLRKSKSRFLDETSSSESEDEENYNCCAGPLDDDSPSSTSTEDIDDDQEYYLNQEFLTKITLHKIGTGSTFRSVKDSNHKLNGEVFRSRDTEQLVVRPLQSRPNLQTRIQNQKDLQICFLSDFPMQTSSASSGRSSSESADYLLESSSKPSEGPHLLSQDFWSPPLEPSSSKNMMETLSMPKSQSMFEMGTETQKSDRLISNQFEETEARWRQEMQAQIQRSHQRIHLQMQRQRRKHKRSPISTKVQFPYGKSRLDQSFLADMKISHLQIVLNDLHGHVENLNDDLVRLLEERDELHMEQDSKLVDIDDLTRRMKELWMVNGRRKKLQLAQNPDRLSQLANKEFTFGNFLRDQAKSVDGAAESPDRNEPVNGGQQHSGLRNFRQRIRSLLQ